MVFARLETWSWQCSIVNEMQNKGFKIDHLVFNILADGFRNKGMTNEVFELQALMGRKGGVNTK